MLMVDKQLIFLIFYNRYDKINMSYSLKINVNKNNIYFLFYCKCGFFTKGNEQANVLFYNIGLGIILYSF